MSWQQQELLRSNHSNKSTDYRYPDHGHKPVELYVFLDPLSNECWSLQFYLKKLMLEYGRFFKTRPVVSGSFSLAYENTAHAKADDPMHHKWVAYLAIKAAELQGKKAGNKFLQKIQEKVFFERCCTLNEDILMQCAYESNLDVQEFARDLFSPSAKKAYQCDRRITREMDVDQLPTIVFFNQVAEEHGIKISGLYPYEIYELVLSEILQYQPIPSAKPPLEEYVSKELFVTTKEIAVIYGWTNTEAQKEMKKLQFKQKVTMLSCDQETIWKALN